ncbi:Secreted protein containing N-terminal Zinc-dependentcarboxypeptidase related domain [Oceanicaulis sp. HTCC2633]|uniref:M14 family metallopeptidase n=1 Tax=Oceanicaulis sp. HTCC2633 TaxID=314254 RepID=UPI000066D599|nr:M14 family metallopeptidase [Oceanicaulis sp. HTCC2633]EAP90846.1 Secreted protein containing N-terminal Zinc-dependentcarboxypeptidase related domain [Oceanicaulis sp. HTCC2633]
MLRALALSLALALPTAGAASAYFEPDYTPKPIADLLDFDARYDAAIPTPEAVLGYQSGEIIFTPEMHAAYIQAVAAASDRVSVQTIGRSHFGRPILRVTITSPANQARLEEIRQTQLTLSEPNAQIPEDQPVVVQFTHGVHGSESSGYDSAPLILYHLAAAQGAEIETLLDETVIHQIVMINPDGANRFAQWTNMHHANVPVADPQHREHYYEWPWGRTNHYWFDINRQWLPVTQPEARALVSATQDWRPNVAADLHEMGENSSFFISPGPREGLHPLLSQSGFDLNLELNQTLNTQLDEEGAVYVSEELFDDFYLGYGSSYPGLIGSIPYLFEQSSVRGIVQETEYGVQRYDDKIAQQARTAIALIRSAHDHRAELQGHMREFFGETRQMANSDAVRAYVFGSSDRGRLSDFIDMLATHRIEVRELAQSFTHQGHEYRPGEAFIVPLRQDQYRTVRALFETRVITNKVEFYDVSGWTQPLAYDLDYAELRGGQFRSQLTGDVVTGFEMAEAAPDTSALGYVMEWDNYYAPRALYRLLDAGVRARVIPDETTIRTTRGDQEIGRGAVMIELRRQPLNAQDIHALLTRAALEDGVKVHAVTSGSTSRGSDLGGFALSNVEKPEVLLVTGRGISPGDAGEVWHLLDHDMHMPVSMIDQSELGGADLSRYTHIILPHGRLNRLSDDFPEALGRWVRSGGTLIATGNAARWAIDHELSGATIAELETPEADAAPAPRYEDIAAWDAEMQISGAIFDTRIDTSHPLAFGFRDDRLPSHRSSDLAFAVGDNPLALPVRYAPEDPILSGYASEELRRALSGQGALYAERRGSGSVILFADDPYYRAYYRGTARLMMNAIFFGNDFRNAYRRTDG